MVYRNQSPFTLSTLSSKNISFQRPISVVLWFRMMKCCQLLNTIMTIVLNSLQLATSHQSGYYKFHIVIATVLYRFSYDYALFSLCVTFIFTLISYKSPRLQTIQVDNFIRVFITWRCHGLHLACHWHRWGQSDGAQPSEHSKTSH